MANSVLAISIPPATDLDSLRNSLQSILTRMATEIASNRLTAHLDANSNRITGLGDPSNGQDAVNLQTLRKEVGRSSNSIRLSAGGSRGSVISSDTSTIVTNNGVNVTY